MPHHHVRKDPNTTVASPVKMTLPHVLDHKGMIAVMNLHDALIIQQTIKNSATKAKDKIPLWSKEIIGQPLENVKNRHHHI